VQRKMTQLVSYSKTLPDFIVTLGDNYHPFTHTFDRNKHS